MRPKQDFLLITKRFNEKKRKSYKRYKHAWPRKIDRIYRCKSNQSIEWWRVETTAGWQTANQPWDSWNTIKKTTYRLLKGFNLRTDLVWKFWPPLPILFIPVLSASGARGRTIAGSHRRLTHSTPATPIDDSNMKKKRREKSAANSRWGVLARSGHILFFAFLFLPSA